MILFLTTTCKERVGAMVTTISTVMHHLRQCNDTATFVLAYTDGYKPERELCWLSLIAGTLSIEGDRSNIIWIDASNLSVAHTKQLPELGKMPWDTFVNLDDDLLVDQKAVTRIVHYDYLDDTPWVVTYGCWDPVNVRGFADWDDVAYPSIQHFTQVHQLKHAKVHRFSKITKVYPYHWISQLYQMPRSIWENEMVWRPVLDEFKEPGVRGYDIKLEEQLNEHEVPIIYYAGVESIHFGLEQSYLNDKWKSANEIVKNNVTLLGDL